jgi:hypothetical protein
MKVRRNGYARARKITWASEIILPWDASISASTMTRRTRRQIEPVGRSRAHKFSAHPQPTEPLGLRLVFVWSAFSSRHRRDVVTSWARST